VEADKGHGLSLRLCAAPKLIATYLDTSDRSSAHLLLRAVDTQALRAIAGPD